mmetsp:Transcript_3458/g.8580  ORF Transcript_3458/g.8580 Transcript_3458/m.8580 type:complete len:225 (-) Transcript_3458:61-735(-)
MASSSAGTGPLEVPMLPVSIARRCCFTTSKLLASQTVKRSPSSSILRLLARNSSTTDAVLGQGGTGGLAPSVPSEDLRSADACWKSAGSRRSCSAHMTPSQHVRPRLATTSAGLCTLPLARTGMPTAARTTMIASRSAASERRHFCASPQSCRPCTASRAQPASSSSCASWTVAARVGCSRILQKTGMCSSDAAVHVRTISAIIGQLAASCANHAPYPPSLARR